MPCQFLDELPRYGDYGFAESCLPAPKGHMGRQFFFVFGCNRHAYDVRGVFIASAITDYEEGPVFVYLTTVEFAAYPVHAASTDLWL